MFEIPYIIPKLETISSFPAIPNIRATIICQEPNPVGFIIGDNILINSGFTYANAISLIVFSLLYTPCIAAFTTMHKEFQSKKWTIFSLIYQLFIAWLLSTLAYQIFR